MMRPKRRCDHWRQQHMRKLARRGHHDAQEGLLVFPSRARIIAGHGISRVVDEAVDGQPMIADGFDEPLDAVRMRQILRDGRRADCVLFGQLFGERLQPLQPAGCEHHIPALGREELGKSLADARRCARYQCRSAANILHLDLRREEKNSP